MPLAKVVERGAAASAAMRGSEVAANALCMARIPKSIEYVLMPRIINSS
jgi:hypothetical protein